MATLFPKDFNIKEIENASERHVVDLLINRLGHEWIVSPNFKFHDGKRDREIDVIVLNPIYGVGIIEVKGGQETREGRRREQKPSVGLKQPLSRLDMKSFPLSPFPFPLNCKNRKP